MSTTAAALTALVGIASIGLWLLGLLVAVASVEDYRHQRGAAGRKTARMDERHVAREKSEHAAQVLRLGGGEQ